MILVLLTSIFGSCAHASQLDVYGSSVLEYAGSDINKPVAAVGVIDSLYEIERRSLKKEEVYVALLDYYLGSGGGAVLNELITQNGNKILPLLKQKLGLPILCLPEYQLVCVKRKEQRNIRISRLINAINSDVVLCVDKSKTRCGKIINE